MIRAKRAKKWLSSHESQLDHGKKQAAHDNGVLGALCPDSQYKNVDRWTIEDEGEVSGIVSAKLILGAVSPASRLGDMDQWTLEDVEQMPGTAPAGSGSEDNGRSLDRSRRSRSLPSLIRR